MVTTVHQAGPDLGPLKDHAEVGLVRGLLNGLVDQWLVFDHFLDFDAAGRRHQSFW